MNRTARTTRRAAALTGAAVLVLAGCSQADPGGSTAAGGDDATAGADGLTPVTLQLQWFTQGQFAGYYAALDQGFYEEQGLDVTIAEGGTDIVPQTVLAQGQADYAVAWVPKALASREQGAAITDVGQVFQRSGTLQVSFADEGVAGPADLAGRTVGDWGFGNEFELFAGMTEAGLDPASDVSLVQQQFDMQALLNGDIDAAQAMTYNEYAQVLEARDPETGELYQPEDFSVIDWNDVGTAMLQDAVWASTERLDDEAYQEQTVAFLTASLQGWIYCRDDAEACRDVVVERGSTLGASHQLWQVNEVNKLVWPSEDGVGTIRDEDWQQTVDVALATRNADGATVITDEPDEDAYTNEYVEQAQAALEEMGLDVTGEDYEPVEVTLEEGGA